MGRVPYSEFERARARALRLSDKQTFSGWLAQLRCDRVQINFEDAAEFRCGEKFLVQIQGPSADAYFIAGSTERPGTRANYVRGAVAMELDLHSVLHEFNVLSQIRFRDSDQLARKLIATLEATLKMRGQAIPVLLMDASVGGMGIMAWSELAKGDVVHVQISTQDVNADFFCEVRHCRPEPRLPGAYRAGLKFKSAERRDLLMWKRLFDPI